MKVNDSRSFRMVIMADYMNPGRYKKLPGSPHVYELVRDSGFGIIKMPHVGTPTRSVRGWLSSLADQIQEYGKHGFKVTLLGMTSLPGKGVWVPELKHELSSRMAKMPPMKSLSPAQVATRESTEKRLRDFLG